MDEAHIAWRAADTLGYPFGPVFQLIMLTGCRPGEWGNARWSWIDFKQMEENRLLKERLGGRRLRFTDAERHRLARRAYVLGCKAFSELDTLVTPDTLCSHSNGFFQIESGYGKLVFTDREGLRITTERIPYEGTLVAAQIAISEPHLLGEALRFGGKVHRPIDYVELKYEQYDSEDLLFKLIEESPSFGSRVAGAPIRKKLLNLARMCPDRRILLDFQDVPLVSSSFADEVVGKLFAELGPLAFMQRFQFRNIDQTARQLVDRAIAQRMSVGGAGK